MKIVTVHDVFRSSVFHMPDLEESIGPWLHALLSPLLNRLGHTTAQFSLRETGTLLAVDGGGTIARGRVLG